MTLNMDSHTRRTTGTGPFDAGPALRSGPRRLAQDPTAQPAARTRWASRPMAPQLQATKQRHPVRNFFRVLLILLLVFVVWLIGVPAYAWTQIARVDAAPSGQRPADQPGKTFLLVGSDSRAGLSKAEQRRLGTGSAGGQRTDTISWSTSRQAASRL